MSIEQNTDSGDSKKQDTHTDANNVLAVVLPIK